MIAIVHVSIEISMEADEKRERRKDGGFWGGGGGRERKLHNSFGTLFRIYTHTHTRILIFK